MLAPFYEVQKRDFDQEFEPNPKTVAWTCSLMAPSASSSNFTHEYPIFGEILKESKMDQKASSSNFTHEYPIFGEILKESKMDQKRMNYS